METYCRKTGHIRRMFIYNAGKSKAPKCIAGGVQVRGFRSKGNTRLIAFSLPTPHLLR